MFTLVRGCRRPYCDVKLLVISLGYFFESRWSNRINENKNDKKFWFTEVRLVDEATPLDNVGKIHTQIIQVKLNVVKNDK